MEVSKTNVEINFINILKLQNALKFNAVPEMSDHKYGCSPEKFGKTEYTIDKKYGKGKNQQL